MSERSERVGIIGLGYVGLPLAVAFCEAGNTVVGVDADARRVESVNSGVSHIEDVPSETIERLAGDGLLTATADFAALGGVGAVLICLPTPLDEHRVPDLSAVVSGIEGAAEHISPGTLVVLESTTYPGTTREVLLPVLERDGGRVGEDFFLAFGPERVDPGNRKYNIQNTPKVVGGMTPECTRRAVELYEKVTPEVHPVSAPESAEMSKLLENIFRGVNIALVNELAMLCDRMEIDVWEVIEAASTKPFGFMPFYPGPGLGGHCIPLDPSYLSWRARAYDATAEFIELAGRVNVNMPYYAADRVLRSLNDDGKPVKGSRVLILGMSYKPDMGDLRESPALKMLDLLQNANADVVYHDPYVPELPKHGLASVDLTDEELEGADCVVIATEHSDFDMRLIVARSKRIVDLRNAVRKRLEDRAGGPLPEGVDVL